MRGQQAGRQFTDSNNGLFAPDCISTRRAIRTSKTGSTDNVFLAAEYGVVIHNYEAYCISESGRDVIIGYLTAQKDLAVNLARQLRARSLRV